MKNLSELFFKSKLKLKQFCKESNIDSKIFSEYLKTIGYIVNLKMSGENIYKLKLAILDYKNSKRTHNQIGNIYNISGITMKSVLISLGIFDSNRTHLKYNPYIFDSIDTEEKAYWLGFIYADGYIYNIKPRNNGSIDYNFELCTKGSDIEHMRKFAKFIEHETPVKETKADKLGHTRCRVCVSNKHLWETLNTYGCTPKKSLTLKFPNLNIFKDMSLVRHFIRGYFDGDGCISYSNIEHNHMYIQLLGTKEFLTETLSQLSMTSNLYHNHNNDKETTM